MSALPTNLFPFTAHVRPMEGKHYGTDVVARTGGMRTCHITVWTPWGRPSAEDLAQWDVTPDGWDANVEVDDGWGGTEPIQRMHPTDGHYQSEIEAAIAKRIAWALDGFDPSVTE